MERVRRRNLIENSETLSHCRRGFAFAIEGASSPCVAVSDNGAPLLLCNLQPASSSSFGRCELQALNQLFTASKSIDVIGAGPPHVARAVPAHQAVPTLFALEIAFGSPLPTRSLVAGLGSIH